MPQLEVISENWLWLQINLELSVVLLLEKPLGEFFFLTPSCFFYEISFSGCLDVSAFERLLGPCKEIMQRNVELYAKELAELT